MKSFDNSAVVNLFFFLNLLAQVTPYHNMKLRGVIHKTILRGSVVYERDRVCDSPAGQLLLETGHRYSSTSIENLNRVARVLYTWWWWFRPLQIKNPYLLIVKGSLQLVSNIIYLGKRAFEGTPSCSQALEFLYNLKELGQGLLLFSLGEIFILNWQ